MSESLENWRQQKGESARAFQAAQIYFEMGAGRSQEAVASKLAKSRQIISRWSVRWAWVERALDYDAAEQVKRQVAIDKANADETTKWAKRQAQIREEGFSTYLALKAKADLMLQFPLKTERLSQDGKTVIIEPADWSFNTAVRMQETALKLGRLSADLSTENFDFDPAKLSDKQLAAAKEALRSGRPVAAAIEAARD